MLIHFSGVGGSGLSALAAFMRMRGHEVSGSDRAFDSDPSHPLRAPLDALGVRIHPQDGSALSHATELMVASTAVEADTPEFLAASSLGVRVMSRPEFLIELSKGFRGIAVSGTSGKSTSSGLMAYLMRELGLGPNFIGGGRVVNFDVRGSVPNVLAGGSDLMVMEACESDGSIIGYRPHATLLLNLAMDHHEVAETASMFRALIGNTTGPCVVNADDPLLRRYALHGTAGFAIRSQARYKAEGVRLRPLHSEFSLGGVECRLNLPGLHNVYNAIGVLGLLAELGVSLAEAARHLPGFRGIRRRFEVHLNERGRLVVDDYAHNPHKIEALMQAAREVAPAIAYVFQPHGFGPLKLMLEGYVEAFASGLRPSDALYVLPVYYAGGRVSSEIGGRDLAVAVASRGANARYVESREELQGLGREAFFVLGARDETLATLAAGLADRLRAR